jgi:uncharacterized Zn-binding protein involved in type VI secretion
MSKTVAINPPKTPCTSETRGFAKCTIPNICKMPGPPAPFIPTPLPNIGKSNLSPKGYSKTVKLVGETVAIRGATFESIGDMASKGTGGGLISANTHGPTKFITPGSMNVKIEGKNVHLLGEPMLNNCGPSGSPPNTGATMLGFDTWDLEGGEKPLVINCKGAPHSPKPGRKKFTECEIEEICAKCAEINEMAKPPGGLRSADGSYEANREEANKKCAQLKGFAKRGSEQHEELGGFDHVATQKCKDELSKKAKRNNYRGFSPDHRREVQLCGHPTALSNLKWMSSRPNSWMGTALKEFKTAGPDKNTGVAPDCCDNFK